jgi:hemerythrin-like domain-containing protein
MATETLAGALEREHREIDAGIEAYTSAAPGEGADVGALRTAMSGLRRHIYLEEQFLCPPLRSVLMAPIFVMLREHGEMWQVMDRLDEALAQDARGAEATKVCSELVPLLETHNSKEEAIIYSQADAVLTAPAVGELLAFIESGQMPDGWVCAKA